MAQEIKANDIYRDDLFAATPPLEAKKMLFSLAATKGIGYFGSDTASGMKIEFIDIRRAYYQAHARRQLYVKLPAEDYTPGMCGRLNKALQGTRDAAQCWEYEYNKFMVDELGFKRGRCSPCVFYHEEQNLRAVIHGDDFKLLGFDNNLDWFKSALTAKWQVKIKGRIGPKHDDSKIIHVFNRLVDGRKTASITKQTRGMLRSLSKLWN